MKLNGGYDGVTDPSNVENLPFRRRKTAVQLICAANCFQRINLKPTGNLP